MKAANDKANKGILLFLCAFFVLSSSAVIAKKAVNSINARRAEETAAEEPFVSPYVTGAENHLFLDTGDGKNEETYIDAYAEHIAKMQKYCNDRGIDFVFELDQGKSVVYSDLYTHDDIDRYSRNEYILEKMAEHGVSTVYTYDALVKEREQQPVFGIRYDTGHWNGDGAYAAVAAVTNVLREDNPGIGVPSRDNYIIREIVREVNYEGHAPSTEPVREYATKDNIKTTDIYKNGPDAFWANSYSQHINSANTEAPKLLIFGGSYMEKNHKLYTPYFSEVVYIKSYFNFINFEYYISLFKPDIVIMETADYVMKNDFGTTADMADRIHSQSYASAASLAELSFFFPVELNVDYNGKVVNFNGRVVAGDISGGYLIAGDSVYDCVIIGNRGVINLRSVAIAEDIENEPLSLVLVSGDGTRKQEFPIQK